MMYTIVISSGQVSQPPDARGNGYPCTSCAKLLKTKSYNHEKNTYSTDGFGGLCRCSIT